jgi:hypothetical protein
MEINVRIYNKGKLVKRRIGQREDWKKIHGKLASAVGDKYLVEVDYGLQEDVFGNKVKFFNKGTYTNSKDAKQALSAFIEI